MTEKQQQAQEDFSDGWDVGVDALEMLANLVSESKEERNEGMLLMGVLAVFLDCIYRACDPDDADEMLQNAMKFSRDTDHEPDGTVH